jgi:hypothetical protein
VSIYAAREKCKGGRSADCQSRRPEDPEKEGILLASSAVRILRRMAHLAMRGTGACLGITGRPPANPDNISARMGRDVRIRYSTIGAVSSSTSGGLSSGKLLR